MKRSFNIILVLLLLTYSLSSQTRDRIDGFMPSSNTFFETDSYHLLGLEPYKYNLSNDFIFHKQQFQVISGLHLHPLYNHHSTSLFTNRNDWTFGPAGFTIPTELKGIRLKTSSKLHDIEIIGSHQGDNIMGHNLIGITNHFKPYDKLLVSISAYTGSYYMGHWSPNRTNYGALRIDISYEASDAVTLEGYGYFPTNRPPINSPNFIINNTTGSYYGGSIKYQINENLGIKAGFHHGFYNHGSSFGGRAMGTSFRFP